MTEDECRNPETPGRFNVGSFDGLELAIDVSGHGNEPPHLNQAVLGYSPLDSFNALDGDYEGHDVHSRQI